MPDVQPIFDYGICVLCRDSAPLVEAGEEVDDEYYLLWRLEQGIPEGCIEIPKGTLDLALYSIIDKP